MRTAARSEPSETSSPAASGAAARVADNAHCVKAGDLDLADTGRARRCALARAAGCGPLLAALEQALAALAVERSPRIDDRNRSDPRQQRPERPAERVLRVSETKIEALVNLAGELVVAKNALVALGQAG